MAFMERLIQKVINLAPRLKKRTFDPEAMSIEDIHLPHALNEVDIETIRKTIADDVSIYKSLGYKDKTLEHLKKSEYHSLQIGLMLRFIKEEKVFLIANLEDIIPSFINGITKSNLHKKVFDIVYRYDLIVNKNSTLVELENEIKWTPQEAAYLLRYINLEDRKITAR